MRIINYKLFHSELNHFGLPVAHSRIYDPKSTKDNHIRTFVPYHGTYYEIIWKQTPHEEHLNGLIAVFNKQMNSNLQLKDLSTQGSNPYPNYDLPKVAEKVSFEHTISEKILPYLRDAISKCGPINLKKKSDRKNYRDFQNSKEFQSLVKALEKEKIFRGTNFQDLRLHNPGYVSPPLNITYFCFLLILRGQNSDHLCASSKALDAIDAMNKSLGNEECTSIVEFFFIDKIILEEEYKLSKSIKITPIDQFTTFDWKSYFRDSSFKDIKPTAVISANYQWPIFSKHSILLPDLGTEIDELLKFLSIYDFSPPEYLTSCTYIQSRPSIFKNHRCNYAYSSGGTLKKSNGFHSRLITNFDGADLLYSKLKNLNSELRLKLSLSLDRFKSSQNYDEGELANKAIDLGIALECLLLSKSEKSELKYRLSLRGAMYLGKNLKERKRIFETLKKAYDLRSDAVHNGKVINKEMSIDNRKTHPLYVLQDATDICSAIIKKIIDNQGFPDWENTILQPETSECQTAKATEIMDEDFEVLKKLAK